MLNLTFRTANQNDSRQILEIYGPIVQNTSISFEEVSPTENEMKIRIMKVTSTYPWIVATDMDSQILGYAYASQHRDRVAYQWSVEVSAYVRDGYRGPKSSSTNSNYPIG